MLKHKFKNGFMGLVLVGCLTSGTVLAEMVVITHPSSDTESLTMAEAKALFLKKKSSFPSGSDAVPGNQTEGSAIYDEFGKKVLKKKPQQLSSYWSKRVFSGKAMPPKVIGDDQAIKAWVAQTPGSLGYVDAGVVDDSVKVLLRVP